MTTDDMDTADVLDAAADYIRIHGWRKHDYGNDGGPRCVLGALKSVGDFGEWRHVTNQPPALALLERIGKPVEKWNDARRRTASEIIDALMSCAADLRLRSAANGEG